MIKRLLCFTDMITVKKAFRRLSVEGCEVIGKGANGTVLKPGEMPDMKETAAGWAG